MELSSAELIGFDYEEHVDNCEIHKYFCRIPTRFVIPTELPESPSESLSKIAPENMVKSIRELAECRIYSINDPYSTYETEYIKYIRHQIRYGTEPEPTKTIEDKLNEICRMCDKCKTQIPWINPRYANNETEYDLCLSCKEKHPELVEEMSLTYLDKDIETKTREFEELSNFGQMFDWLPLYVGNADDECGSYIMICANPDSTLFGRLALATDDDHGRTGISICEKGTTLTELLNEYDALKKKVLSDKDSSDDEDRGGWDEFYSMPIKKMMEKRGMQIHFG